MNTPTLVTAALSIEKPWWVTRWEMKYCESNGRYGVLVRLWVSLVVRKDQHIGCVHFIANEVATKLVEAEFKDASIWIEIETGPSLN